MAAKFTPKIRTFVASSLIDNVVLQQIPEWTTGVNYNEGTLVYYLNNKYVAKANGTAGVNPPVHLSGTLSDGGMDWIFVESITANQMFKRNMFVFIGKPTVWDNELIPDDAGIWDIDDFETIKNIITLKRVSSNNFRLAIKRYNWTSGTVYSQYSDSKDPLAISGDDSYSTPYYTYTEEGNIYKCINNNNGVVSTIKPTFTGTATVKTGDGYVWKYMGSLEADSVFFLTRDFIPARLKLSDDSSTQWATQEAAVPGSLSTFRILNQTGSFSGIPIVTLSGGTPLVPATAYATKTITNTINQILVDHANNAIGSGYDLRQKVYATVKDAGAAGSGATITGVTVTGGVITDITFTAGTGYTNATVILYDLENTPTTPAVVSATIAPNNTIEDIVISNGGAGYSSNVIGWVIPGTSGAVGEAVFAPKDGHGSNILTELCANTAIVNVRLTEETNYLLTGVDSDFRQVGLITDVVEYGTNDTAYGLIYMGPSHPLYNNPAYNRIDSNKGNVLYLNNIKSAVRSDDQEEDIKIAITF